MATSASYGNAWLPCVYNNAYRYDNITTNGIVWKNTNSTFAALSLPSETGQVLYATVTQNNSGSNVYAYNWVHLIGNSNYLTGFTSWQNINAATVLSGSTYCDQGYKYTPQITFELYVDDITLLSPSDISLDALAVIDSLPTILIELNTAGDTYTTLGTYTIPPNQNFIHVNMICDKIVMGASGGNKVRFTPSYHGVPASKPYDGFLKIRNVKVIMVPGTK